MYAEAQRELEFIFYARSDAVKQVDCGVRKAKTPWKFYSMSLIRISHDHNSRRPSVKWTEAG